MEISDKQYFTLAEVAKQLGLGTSTLSKKINGLIIEGLVRNKKCIEIYPIAIPQIKIIIEYNNQFEKGNYLSTHQVAEILKATGFNTKRTDINNWIRTGKVESIIHLGYRYIEKNNCSKLAQLIIEERTIPSGYLSIIDSANLINVHPNTIITWASHGEIDSKFVIIDNYKRLYVSPNKLMEVKLKRAIRGLRNFDNVNIEKLIEKNDVTSFQNVNQGTRSELTGEPKKIDPTMKWLTVSEAAKFLNVKYNTILTNYLRRGKFPCAIKEKNIWFIPESDVANYEVVRFEKEVPEQYLSIKQSRKLLNLNSSSIYKLIKKGFFPLSKKDNNLKWIIHIFDINSFLENKPSNISSMPRTDKKAVNKVLPDFLSISQVSKLLNMNTTSIYPLIHKGTFPSAEKYNNLPWVIHKSEIESYLEAKNLKTTSIKKPIKVDVPLDYYSIKQSSKLLNINNQQIYTLIKNGVFPSAKKHENLLWIIHITDINNYLEGKYKKPISVKKTVKVDVPLDYYSIKQTSKLFNISNQHVYRLVKSGVFPSAKKHENLLWIIHITDLNNNLEGKYSVIKSTVVPEDYLTIEQSSKLLNMNSTYVTRLVKKAIFPSAKKHNNLLWIIAKTDIDQYLKTKERAKIKFDKGEIIQELIDYLENISISSVIDQTHHIYIEYAQIRMNATGGRANNIRRVMNHLKMLHRIIIINLKVELYELSNEGIESILKNHRYSNPIRELFVSFLRHSCKVMGINREKEYMFSRKHKSSKIHTKDEYYSPEIYQRYVEYVKRIEEHVSKAITDRHYANMWVLVSMLTTTGWRPSDIIFEMPHIEIGVIRPDSLNWFKQDKLTLEECHIIINQLYLKLLDVEVSKTTAYLHFLVAPDMVECMATACVISELHSRAMDPNIMDEKRQLLGTFITGSQPKSAFANTSGQEKHKRFLEADAELQFFSSKKLNISTMTYLFFDVTDDNQDDAELAIENPQWIRSHDDLKTTSIYIKVTNKDGSLDRVSINLFKRGHFGWLYNYMVRLACSQQGQTQRLEERTTTIQALRDEYTPMQLEGWAQALLHQKQGKENVIQRLSRLPRNTLLQIIVQIYKGKMPSRDGCGQCLQFPECKYPQRKTCIGCPEFIPRVQEVMIAAKKEFYRLIESIKTNHSETIIQRDSLFLINVLVLFQEATNTFGQESVNSVISTTQRKEALYNIAEILRIKS